MMIIEFLKHGCIAILLAYLSLTNALADRITTFLETPEEAPSTIEEAAPATAEESAFNTSPSEKLTTLSKTFALARSIPTVLLDNPDFQAAALSASGILEPDASANTLSPDTIEHALVNIFCEYKTKDYIRTTTGTGFFISSRGVILTNAHVAQFLLLTEVDDSVLDASCVVRAGNPAVPTYAAKLLYISPTWIVDNAKLITEETPRGTGENDFALLYISHTLNEESTPEAFPALSVHTELLSRSLTGSSVLSAGYPAEKLYREGADAKLNPVVASTTVGELYTFKSNYADIFDISASRVGEQGSSGGPVVDLHKGVLGLIVTKGDEKSQGAKSLRALSLSYIDRTITEETGFSLKQNTQGDLAYRGRVFKTALVPFLSDLLTTQIETEE